MTTPVYKFCLRNDLKDDKRFLPCKSEKLASGWDVRCAEKEGIVLKPFDRVKIDLGFKVVCPDGWWLSLNPRSSSFTNRKLHCLYGIIDESFSGTLKFACQFIPELNGFERFRGELEIKFGEAIGQLLPVRRQEMVVEEINEEELMNLHSMKLGNRDPEGFGGSDRVK